jgi:hypothetical protein
VLRWNISSQGLIKILFKKVLFYLWPKDKQIASLCNRDRSGVFFGGEYNRVDIFWFALTRSIALDVTLALNADIQSRKGI